MKIHPLGYRAYKFYIPLHGVFPAIAPARFSNVYAAIYSKRSIDKT